MKKKHLLATLLALLMLLSVFPVTAGAYYREPVRINVDGSFISDVDAYLDDDKGVRVSTGEDLLKIFPRELKNTIIAYDPLDGILLEDYIDDFDYNYRLFCDYNGSQSGYTLYIYTGKSTGGNILGSNLPTSDYEYPEVYINGIYTPLSSPYFYWNLDLSKYQTPVFSGNRVYLNNDGNSPVEILVNGNLVHFPDQQPIVVNPGRTMVPVRTIAEMVNCNVEWNSKLKCAEITQGRSIMRIYPGNTSYQFDGRFYQMDVKPFVLNGRTMVPIRFIAEAFGYTVDHYTTNLLTVTLDSQ